MCIRDRVIEYIVKSKNDNLFFKAWPEKTYNDKKPFRERGYYPYGGFEDFLGQASMETHKIYDAKIIKSCLLYKSDAADERSSVDLGGRPII